MTHIEFSDLSYKLTKKLAKDVKKNNGIYFTPPNTVRQNITYIEPYMKNIKNILEPSCGSCEYILALHERFPDTIINGIEYNQVIYDEIKHISNEKIHISNNDFLKFTHIEKYDLIIGNPPYYVLKKDDVNTEYYKYFDGRPNIFITFILKSIELLNDKGIISFVLPKSFLNCLYYDKTRNFINKSMTILNILECNDKYIETQQDTIIFIIQKDKTNDKNKSFVKDIGNYTIFGTKENIIRINKLTQNSTSLFNLNFKINIGTVVWNQVKGLLCNDETKTRLIYSNDIKDNKLSIKQYSNEEKKNFINKNGITKPLLVINRGYGVGKYIFEYCIINEDRNDEYLIENHLMCVNYTKDIDKEELVKLYKKIIKSLEDVRTLEFVKIYFGNSAINSTELNYVLPIYIQDI